MGLLMSLAGKGLPTTQVIDKVTGKFHELFLKRDIDDLEGFHLAVLDMFVTVNSALPGKHFIVPPLDNIKECFENLKLIHDEEGKKEEVLKFLKENILPNKSDNTLLIIGLATPPAAMAAKKAGEGVPQLKFIKSVPDVLFVPAATLLTLASVKLSRRLFIQRAASDDHLIARNHQGTSDSG
ncbi:hypothetical protein P3L10_003150 [Capsicum annuum]|uniref:uncharacterized protein LOC107845119 n=1 Tax=Capsicum annuum TaxID=4072 RepID=UPI0007BF1579|nr:uncharacterized protein LOC107845119 [Capsicum annuum]